MRARWCVILVAATACLRPNLEGRACPCADDYVCVDDICVARASLTACTDHDDCATDEMCTESVCLPVPCPAQFLAEDACGGSAPEHVTLARLCDDGRAFPQGLRDEAGDGLGGCLDAPTTITATDAAGTLSRFDSVGPVLLQAAITGTVTFDVDIPISCEDPDFVGCEPSAGSGSCARQSDTDRCGCKGVVVSIAEDAAMYGDGAQWAADATYYQACAAENGTYLFREAVGSLYGPILVFR